MAKNIKMLVETAPPLTVENMRKGIDRIKRRIADVNAFDPHSVTERWAPETKALQRSIEETLESIFGIGTSDFRRYISASELDIGSIILGGGPEPIHKVYEYLERGKRNSLVLLTQAVKSLEERIAYSAPIETEIQQTLGVKERSNCAFVVHGHDAEPREAVARFLSKLGLEAIILHEQANQGSTVIEKFERNAFRSDFAIVLLTPDDIGGKTTEKLKSRARQNVILELGYFIGKLGRSNVCALVKGDIELPSDLHGIVWTPFDGGWQLKLGQELTAAGYSIDWNKIMNSASS